MCGITAYIGNKNASEKLVNGLKRLEYRGYDSAGVATLKNGIEVRKDTGEIEDIDEMHNLTSMEGDIGLGHTRWATHGGVTRENAHPHTSCDGRITLVHNGIIENYEEIKSELEGHEFTSETDSEVVAHFFEEKLEEGTETREAIKKFMGKAEGTYAIVLLDSEEEKIYAIKKKSPLALGLGEGEYYIGSDIYAFSNYTDKAVFLGDDEFAVIDREGYEVYSKNGEKKEKEVKKFDWTQEEGEKEEHDHYMIKEIKEQPKVTKRLLKTFKTSQKKDLNRFLDLIEDHEKVIFTSAGTSYHASLLGVYYLQKAGVEAQALIASEFQNYERVDEDTLVIAVSQSGETMDVLEAIEFSKEKGGTIASIVNVPHSSIQRKSKESLEIHAGQEVCVAATKTFTNQVLTLTKIAERLGMDSNIAGISEEIKEVIERNEEEVKELAKELSDKEDIYVLGRGTTYPVSREIALKLKEIPYIHAEGMMGGELKHGTLALIEEGTPVISLIPQESDEIISNVKEVEARGANSLRISSGSDRFYLPENPSSFALSSTTIGFLLAYYIAKEKGRPIDKPRNLAKSVTVK